MAITKKRQKSPTWGGKREGAGRHGEGRTARIELRLTPEERAAIRWLAKLEERDVSEMIREVILARVEQRRAEREG